MSLEILLKPFKLADEEILAKYSRITKWWEDKGHSVYSLTTPIGLTALISSSYGLTPLLGKNLDNALYFLIFNCDNTINLVGLTGRINREQIVSDAITHYEPLYLFFRNLTRIARLPTIAAGSALLVKSGYDLADYVANGTPSSGSQFFIDFNGALGLIGWASSMYLKDGDPKLLDKEPLWKRAYEKFKEFVSYNPAPQPIPIPIPPRN